ncbi:hypothetical protein G3M48_000695 [Beauveria asiatica]|uniref:Uncharacterized protein n=1 Tax=Beauveria asiatica TaxID=1069075 RepID=A0AAW0RG53_9HYPO
MDVYRQTLPLTASWDLNYKTAVDVAPQIIAQKKSKLFGANFLRAVVDADMLVVSGEDLLIVSRSAFKFKGWFWLERSLELQQVWPRRPALL